MLYYFKQASVVCGSAQILRQAQFKKYGKGNASPSSAVQGAVFNEGWRNDKKREALKVMEEAEKLLPNARKTQFKCIGFRGGILKLGTSIGIPGDSAV
ncbi:MAG: hypothetical protein ACLUKN_14125 [Bacilli bacterium]